jgi:glycosyltransferase involved in cell wall biosynthesis
LNICFVTSEFPHHKTKSSGGIGTSIFNLSKGLVDAGHSVTILVYGQKKDEFFNENEVSFHLIKNIKFKGLSRYLTQKKIQKLLNNLIKEHKVDIVEFPDWTGFSSSIKINCPIVIKLHGSDTYFCHLDNRPIKILNKFHEKKALNNADGLLSVSHYTATVTKKLFNLKSDFEIIPNCIDTIKFENKNEFQEIENTILYFGTLIRKKGLLELPMIFNEVFKKNPKAKLILIGKDASDVLSGSKSTWELMSPLFDKNAMRNVNYLGEVEYSLINKHISKASVCVFPTFAEALPVSWIEAMALEKAIVASDIGWANEVIDNAIDGFLVHPKNHNEFANKILELLRDNELRTSFGKNAKQKVESSFNIQKVANDSVKFYTKIVEK